MSGGIVFFILFPKPLPLLAFSLQHLPCFTSLESQLTPGKTRAERNLQLFQQCVNLITNLPGVEMPLDAKGNMAGTGVRAFAREFLPGLLSDHTPDAASATSGRWRAGSAASSLAAFLELECVC